MLGALNRKKNSTHKYNQFIWELCSCCTHAKHSKVYDFCSLLIPNKAAKPIHCAGSFCNKFIHPYRHTRKQDTRDEKDGVMDGKMKGYILFFLFFWWGVSNQNPPPPPPCNHPWSLQLQIALPPLSPAVCPAKSAHDVSLSQLWVEIHRINRFVRETHAWDCLHAVKLVHLLFRPILPQATGKTLLCSRLTLKLKRTSNTRICKYSGNVSEKTKILCSSVRRPIILFFVSCLSYLSVFYFISRAGQQD